MDTESDELAAALVKLKRRGLMKPGEVAALLRVDPKTVTRWASGEKPKIRSIRTLGGHRRFFAKDIAAILETHDPRAT